MNVHLAMPRPLTAANDTTNPPAAPTVTADMLAAVAAGVCASWSDASEAGHRDEMDIHRHRLDALGTEASFAEADGAAGVLFQLGVASGQLDILFSDHTEDDDSDLLYHEIQRLILRVTQWVERTSGLTREAAGLKFYGYRRLDGFSFGETYVAAAE